MPRLFVAWGAGGVVGGGMEKRYYFKSKRAALEGEAGRKQVTREADGTWSIVLDDEAPRLPRGKPQLTRVEGPDGRVRWGRKVL